MRGGTSGRRTTPSSGGYGTTAPPTCSARRGRDRATRRRALLGQHTEQVFREVLDYSEEELAELVASGALE